MDKDDTERFVDIVDPKTGQLKKTVSVASLKDNGLTAPPPVYTSWEDYVEQTPRKDLMLRCSQIASRANRPRLMSGRPATRVNGKTILAILTTTEGRCHHCGSLAVERRPSGVKGAPTSWEHVGRRIGSLDHIVAMVKGGTNELSNLAWSCLWCNRWRGERTMGATDHGGIQGLETVLDEDEDDFGTYDPGDYDGGYGLGSYFAHAMAKDD